LCSKTRSIVIKLIYCPHCQDIRKLTHLLTTCQCGRSYGQYHSDELNAYYGGIAVPLGIANSSFVDALKNQPPEGMGKRFEAFVIPKKCPTFIRLPPPCDNKPDEEVTFGGTTRKTGVKRGPHRGQQPKR